MSLAVFNLQVHSDRCMQRTPALPSGAAQQIFMTTEELYRSKKSILEKARRCKENMPARQHRTSAPAGAEQARTSARGFPRGLANSMAA